MQSCGLNKKTYMNSRRFRRSSHTESASRMGLSHTRRQLPRSSRAKQLLSTLCQLQQYRIAEGGRIPHFNVVHETPLKFYGPSFEILSNKYFWRSHSLGTCPNIKIVFVAEYEKAGDIFRRW